MNEEFKGIMQSFSDADTVDYNPKNGVTMKDIGDLIEKLYNLPKVAPEYVLSAQEAKTLSLPQLNWLGKNYRVLCSTETQDIIRQKEL